MLRTVFAAMAVGVLATPVFAGDGGKSLDPATYAIGDRDAYEDDYSDEFDKATEGQYKAREGKKEKLSEKAWEFFEYIKDGDPMWSAPLAHECGDPFHSLNTGWPMECAATLAPWRFFLQFKGEMYNQQFREHHGGEDVEWIGRLNLGVCNASMGLPCYKAGGLELSFKYVFGELTELGNNDIFWYEGRAQIIRDHTRHLGTAKMEVKVKWNIWKHDDGISGFGIELKYKYPSRDRTDLLDSWSHEWGGNVIGSLKWWRFTFHANVGAIYTKSTGTLFQVLPATPTDSNPEHPELRPFLTGGVAVTFQIFDFLMAVVQWEGHTNAWLHVLDDTYNGHLISSVYGGLRARVGPLVFEAGIGHGLRQEAARGQGMLSVGVKF